MFIIIQTTETESEITKLVCPHCHKKVPRIGIKKDSSIEGLTFRCRRCGLFWDVKTENNHDAKVH